MAQRGTKKVSLMVDFETLGVSRDSVLLSSGIVVFSSDLILDEYYDEFDCRRQLAAGMKVDNRTVAWWRKTDQREFNRLLYNLNSIGCDVSCILTDNIGDIEEKYKIEHVWSRGHMDFGVLNYHLADKFPYWMHKDCRTLDIFMKMKVKNNHNALGDAKNQVEHVQAVMRRFNAIRKEADSS